MGRKSLKKDRAYLTTTEWASEWGGYKDRSQKPFRQLPFYCCAISFTPFEDPVSNPSLSKTRRLQGYFASNLAEVHRVNNMKCFCQCLRQAHIYTSED